MTKSRNEHVFVLSYFEHTKPDVLNEKHFFIGHILIRLKDTTKGNNEDK